MSVIEKFSCIRRNNTKKSTELDNEKIVKRTLQTEAYEIAKHTESNHSNVDFQYEIITGILH